MSYTVASSIAAELWIETTLGELAEYITSGSRDWSKYYADSGAIFIRTQDINRNRLSLNEVAFVRLPEKVEGKRSLVRKGDLLVTITGANVGKVAVVEGEIPEAYVSQSVCLVRLKDPSLAKFVHLQLTAKRGDKTTVEAMAYGLGRPVLNLENIRSAPIRVAPPKAQVLIVAEIEKQFSRLDEAVANLKRVKANLRRYKASVLKAAAEGKLTEDWRKQYPNVEPASKLLDRILAERRARWRGNGKYREPEAPDVTALPSPPKDWTWARLEQLGVTYGGLTKNPKRAKFTTKLPYLRVANVYANELRLDEIEHIGVQDSELEKLLLHKGDLLVVEGNGSKGQIGRLAIWDGSIDPCVHQNHLIKVRLVVALMNKWILFWLLSPMGRHFIEEVSSSTSGLYTLSVNKVGDLPIIVPPLVEQEQIIAEIERRLSVIAELDTAVQANLTRSDRLRQSILSRAFGAHLSSESSWALASDKEISMKTKSLPTLPAQRESSAEDKRLDLTDVLSRYPNGLPVETLFVEAGYQGDQIDQFYRDLSALASRIEQEVPLAEGTVWPHAGLVNVRLKS